MILVDAGSFPGPALWQGLMLCALPLPVLGLFFRGGKYANLALVAYVILGVFLAVVIIGAKK